MANAEGSLSASAITGEQLSAPYGTTRYTVGSLGTAKAFTGQEADPLTGLYYYHARWYDPVVGLFLSVDAIQGNIQGMDPYAYVSGNPATDNDPSGYDGEPAPPDPSEIPADPDWTKFWIQVFLQGPGLVISILNSPAYLYLRGPILTAIHAVVTQNTGINNPDDSIDQTPPDLPSSPTNSNLSGGRPQDDKGPNGLRAKNPNRIKGRNGGYRSFNLEAIDEALGNLLRGFHDHIPSAAQLRRSQQLNRVWQEMENRAAPDRYVPEASVPWYQGLQNAWNAFLNRLRPGTPPPIYVTPGQQCACGGGLPVGVPGVGYPTSPAPESPPVPVPAWRWGWAW